MATPKPDATENFAFSSSIKEDVWHPKTDSKAYEWWYFDALSDDGSEVFVVIFLDNFVFSPRYNSFCRKEKKQLKAAARLKSDSKIKISDKEISDIGSQVSTFPALAFVYYQNGKPIYRAINEFTSDEFSADTELPACRMGENSFRFKSAPYGSGYLISIKADLRGKRKIEANLEWLSIESDFLPHKDFGDFKNRHTWNLVAPRSDVTGSIKVTDDKGKALDVRHFRGTGYHDHNTDARWLPETVKDWQWGRAHFSDATAVYYRYRERFGESAVVKLFLIKNGEMKSFDAFYEEQKLRRSIYGVKYPQKLKIFTEGGIELTVNQKKPIDESFFYLRFLSEVRLQLPDSDSQEALAITEHLAPKSLKYRWLNWLVNMRIGRGGKGSFL
ncbi:MAG: hypothetical protein ACR2L1_03945 [Pyrinomonadaceae bacterium]